MTKQEELNVFIEKADELIDSKYIIADIKIVNLLKVLAQSDTLIAIFKNCLKDFDYESAKKKYLIKSELFEDRGEFILPQSSKDVLAFVFCILLDIDAKRIIFPDFIKKYFYEDGSFSAGFSAFINVLIKPFKSTVKMVMESVIEGKVQDPIEAITIEEQKREKERIEKEQKDKETAELNKTATGRAIKAIKEYLLIDKTKIKNSKKKEEIKEELIFVVDMLANVIDSSDVDAIKYAFICYKYCAKLHKILFFNRVKKISKLIKEIK